MQRCYPPPPPPSRKFEITFALRRIGNGILAAFAVVFAVAVLAAPDAQAQDNSVGSVCTFADTADAINKDSHALVSLQFDNCNAKGWGAKKAANYSALADFGITGNCYCDIKAKDATAGTGGCGEQISQSPARRCLLTASLGQNDCGYYFGLTLQYLPQRTEENKDSCFVANCPGGQQPSGANMNGETECACPAGQVFHDGACVAASAEVCGGLTPAKFYDAGAGECVAVAECDAPAVLNAGANLCDCPAPNVGADGADAPGDCVAASVGSCGGLTPAKFYDDSGAGECVAFAACRAGATLNRVANQCECAGAAVLDSAGTGCLCESPNVGTPEACAAPSAESCGGLTPAKFYDDSGAGACVAFAACRAGATLNRVANQCECAGAAVLDSAGTGCLCESPNVGTPGACAAPSAESCGGLTPAKFYDDSGAGECVAFAVCAAPAVLNAGTNLCDCPASYAGTDGAAAPGDCVAASVESCGGLSPPKFYDSGAGACVAVAACVAPAVLDAAANLCDCPAPYVGTDGAAAPGDCAVLVPSVENCRDLTPTQFYDSTADACIPFAVCAAPAALNAGTNLCDCPSPNIGTDGAAAPGDCAVIAVCAAPAVRNAGTNLCDCPAPNIGTDGADAPGDCAAPSAEVCGGLTPAKFYDAGAGECVAVAECDAPAVLDAGANLCDCPAPNVGADGAAAPGDCAAPSAESCGGLTPAKFYDSGAGECVAVAVCTSPAVRNTGTNRCDCPAPNVGADGAAAPGDCAAPSAEVCGGLTPAKFYDAGAGECVAVAECDAPAVLNAGANLCDCPAPNVGADGADAPGDCVAASVGSCGGLTPAKFYDDSGAGECVAFAACAAPAVLNAGTNRCDCPAPNVGADGAFPPGTCAAPSAEVCGGLTPAKFYDDSGAGECVAFAACAAPAVLDAGTNRCDCPAPNVGTDGSDAPGDCACPLGQLFKDGACAAPTTPWEKCTAAGWLQDLEWICLVKVNDGDRFPDFCVFDGAPNQSAAAAPHCAAVFGADYSFPFNPNPSDKTSDNRPEYVYNCDPDDENGLIPATINTIGATECACPAGHFMQGGVCVAPSVESCGGLTPAKFYDDSGAGECVLFVDCLAPAELNAGTNLCDCPSPNVGTDGAAAPGDCAVSVPSVENCGGLRTPQFYDSAAGACVPFADCGPKGATLNAEANRCDCPADSVSRGEVCIPKAGDFRGMSEKLLCGAFGGTVRTATGAGGSGGEVCSGMDANDTFCIMDSAAGFPCRGLFKHLRACNVEHDRPALNPFFCGARCIGEMEAVGSGCR